MRRSVDEIVSQTPELRKGANAAESAARTATAALDDNRQSSAEVLKLMAAQTKAARDNTELDQRAWVSTAVLNWIGNP